jgi:hypothetical protein
MNKLCIVFVAGLLVTVGAFADQLAPAIPPGKHGFILRVSTSAAKDIRPGDHLDVISSYFESADPTTSILLSDVPCDKVMPVEELKDAVSTPLVLDLNPKEAEQLAAALTEPHARISVARTKTKKKRSNNDKHRSSSLDQLGT